MSLHIYPDAGALAQRLAHWIAAEINLALKTRQRFSFVLSGGSTPQRLYEELANNYATSIDWRRVDFFWGDERYVPFEDERNNGRMASEKLLQPLNISRENIYRMPTSPSPEEAAHAYEDRLKSYFGEGNSHSFDLTLLGMGGDGHTLSVFPGSPLLSDPAGWVRNVFNKNDGLQRITLMPSLVNQSRNIIFMVQGADKAGMLKNVLYAPHHPDQYPSQSIQPQNGSLLWFVDEAAAGEILHTNNA